jgi:VCBS repeat-containing protein
MAMKSHSSFRKLRCRAQLLFDEVCHRIRAERIQSLYGSARRTLLLSQLEERLLMSASPMVMVAQVASVSAASPGSASGDVSTLMFAAAESPSPESAEAGDHLSHSVDSASTVLGTTAILTDSESPAANSVELVVIDTRVEDYSVLLENLTETSDRHFMVLVLDDSRDGLQQITSRLRELSDVSAVHLISHGDESRLQLGSTVLSEQTMPEHTAEILHWQSLLTDDADILIYGCDVGSGSSGQDFLDTLSILTGADIAASDDPTGGDSSGGDWDLESSSGLIHTRIAITTQGQQQWGHLLDLIPTSQFQVNSTTSNTQTTAAETRGSQNAVAMDDSGDYVVTWSSRNQDGNNWGVYARRFNSSGVAITSEILVNQTTTHEQNAARVATDANGNFVVTWTSRNQDAPGGIGVYARRFSAAGTALSGEFQVNTTSSGDQFAPVVAMNRGGQFLIAWQGEGTGDSAGIFFRRYAADGTALTPVEIKVNPADRGTENTPTAAIDAAGNSAIFWEVNKHIYFQRFNSAGTAVGSETQVDDESATISAPAVAMDGSGNFTVVYREEAVLTGVWGKSYNADGTLRGTDFEVDSGDGASPSIAMAADRQFLVTWQKTGDGDFTGIYARKFNADGSTNGGVYLVNQFTTGTQQNASAAMSSEIDSVIVWSGQGSGDTDGVFARQYGNALPTISAIADTTIPEDTSTSALTFTIGDLETAAGSLTVTATSSNTALVSLSGISLSGTGSARSVTVTPQANQFGTTTITLTVSDGLKTAQETFQVTVTAVADPPQSAADAYSLSEDTTLNVPAVTGVLANDSDADGNSLTVLDYTRPSNGTLTVQSNGAFTYTPEASFFGSDSFQYVTSDGTEGRTRYWKLDGSAGDSIGMANGTVSGAVAAEGQLGQSLQFDGVNDYVQIPDFTYNSEFTVSFWFKVPSNAGTGFQYLYSHGTLTAQNSLNVYLIEHSTPNVTANDVLRTRIRDVNDADNVSGLDVDVNALGLIDNQWHQYTLTTRTGVGSVVSIDGVQRAAISSGGDSFNPSGALYLGSRNDLSSDRFFAGSIDTVQVFNRPLTPAETSGLYSGGTYTGTVSLTVNPVNDPPTIVTNTTASVNEGSVITITTAQLRAVDIDNTASQLTYTLEVAPTRGSLRLAGSLLSAGAVWTQDDINNSRLTYEHNGSETSSDQFRFTLSDGAGGTVSSTLFNFSVSGINDAPVMAPASPSLGSIFTGQTSTSTTVAALLESSVTDDDSTAVSGIAITATSGSGTWQYSLNGSTWLNVGTTSSSQALLLRANDWIRYIAPGSDETAGFSYRAWDQTSPTNNLQGTKYNLATTGTGSISPFSANQNSASLSVIVPNAAPVGNSDTYSVQEDTTLITCVASGWFDARWSARQRITLNNAAGPVLTDTAVLVTLSTLNIDYGRTQNNGQDLRFVDPNGTLLDFEIEEWNESGTSRVWVRVPQIDAASATDFFWLYYDNPTAADAQDATDIWTSQAKAVLHLQGTPADSSFADNSVSADGTAAAVGYIAGGRLFDGIDDELNLGSAASVDNLFSGGGTISAWINPTGWGEANYGRIASKASSTFAGGALGNGWALELDGSTGSLLFENGFSTQTGQWRTASGSISLNTWQMVTLIYDSSSTSANPRLFINGAEVSVTEIRTPQGSVTSDAAQNLKIGNHSVASTRTFDGIIDEFRAWDVSRTSAQILADYRSSVGSLTTIGTVETGPVGVLSNDTDAEGNALMTALVSGPSHSQSFTLNSDGTFSYTPNANFTGTDTFRYSVTDGTSVTGPVTVTIQVTAVNDAPIITSNGGGNTASISVPENSTAVTQVTSTDVDGGSAVYAIIGGTDQSRFSISATTGALSFITAPNFEISGDTDNNNVYQVIVQVADGNGAFDTQTINVNVTNVNEAPVSVPITDINGVEDAPAQVTALSAAFTDPDLGDSLTWSVRNLTGIRSFFQTLSINSQTGQLTWQLNSDVNGTATVEIKATDPGNLSTTQTLRFQISAVDDVPVATSAAFSGFAGNLLVVTAPGLSSSVHEVDGDTLTFIIVRQPTHGTVTLTSGGGFEYRPNTGYSGPDSFDYAASDGITLSNPGTASVQISAARAQSSGESGSGTSYASESSGSSSSESQSSGRSSSVESGAQTPQESGTAGTSRSNSALAAPTATPQQNGSDEENNEPFVGGVSIAGSENDAAILSETEPIGIGQTFTFLAQLNPAKSLREVGSDQMPEHSDFEIPATVLNSSLQLETRQQWFAHNYVMFEQLDKFKEDLSRNVGIDRKLVGSVGAVTTGLSVGYIIWFVRGGMLLSGLLAQMPAWQMLDPLLVIDDPSRKEDDDEETIGSIVDSQQQPPAPIKPTEYASVSSDVSFSSTSLSSTRFTAPSRNNNSLEA